MAVTYRFGPPWRQKRFGGTIFNHRASATTKIQADKQANAWRKKGDTVKVTKDGTGTKTHYKIWTKSWA